MYDDEFAPLTLGEQAQRFIDDCREWKRELRVAYAHWSFKGDEKDELECLLGFKGATEKLLASNIKLRAAASEILAQQFGELRERSVDIPTRRFWVGSFLGPIILERKPVVEVESYKVRIDKLVRGVKLNGVCAIEFQNLNNYPGQRQGCSYLMNAHALLWTDDPNFDVKAARKKLRNNTRIFSELGAKRVKLTDRTLDEGQLEYAGRYMMKPPVIGKYRARHEEVPTRRVLKPTTVRPAWLLRLAEIQSHYELTDLVWGVLDGTEIRTKWKQQLVERNKRQCDRCKQPLERDFDVASLWNCVRERPGNGSRWYNPVSISK